MRLSEYEYQIERREICQKNYEKITFSCALSSRQEDHPPRYQVGQHRGKEGQRRW